MTNIIFWQFLAIAWGSQCDQVGDSSEIIQVELASISLLQTSAERSYRAADEKAYARATNVAKPNWRESWVDAVDGQYRPAVFRPQFSMLAFPNLTQPREPRTERIILHHIWKVGGTHLCQLARKSGFVVPLNDGCHRPVNDSAPVTDMSQDVRAGAVGPGLAEIPFNVVGHEDPVDEEILEKATQAGFQWVGVLRDPVEQAYSWFAHAKRSDLRPETVTEWIDRCTEQTRSTCGWYVFVPNIQTRFLAGRQCYYDPELPNCVDKALGNLRRMAVVLEQRGSQLLGVERLATLGWDAEKEAPYYISGAERERAKAAKEEEATITSMQKVDIELIRAARAQGII